MDNSEPANPQQQLIERLRQANNILVTVSTNPSVDQLAAFLGLTLMLNKLRKHATAVFSGKVPSTIEFLKPEDTLEKNTDSLRDFIIALDKSKADKLRYKVEDKVVKIFITPYRTSITKDDLQFSQGDFNVDAVVALGVHEQQDVDQAITAHGRILHDATVMTITTDGESSLGTINWSNSEASSLSEVVTLVSDALDKTLLDNQIATALLTGIVAETDRFSNARTTPQTMSISAELMAAGADQQLVASKLQVLSPASAAKEPVAKPKKGQPNGTSSKPDDGTLEIAHNNADDSVVADLNEDDEQSDDKSAPADNKDDDIAAILSEPAPKPSPEVTPAGTAQKPVQPATQTPPNAATGPSRYLTDTPPSLGGTLTANSHPEELDPATDPLSLPTVEQHEPLLSHDEPATTPAATNDTADTAEPPLADHQIRINPDGSLIQPGAEDSTSTPAAPFVPAPGFDQPAAAGAGSSAPVAAASELTLSQLEEKVKADEQAAADNGTPSVDSARNAVESALGAMSPGSAPLEPIAALNAQPIDLQPPMSETSAPPPQATQSATAPALEPVSLPSAPTATPSFEPAPLASSPADRPLDMPLPPGLTPPPANPVPPTSSLIGNPTAPPPVPPPMIPPLPFVNPNDPAQNGQQ